ncbi:MAG: hypothetical protein GF329_04220 [Candidatus Lokiarchaeota archaeon]|nr:hypothetical protein [Candidatus Lokiarchaeota archaeon]
MVKLKKYQKSEIFLVVMISSTFLLAGLISGIVPGLRDEVSSRDTVINRSVGGSEPAVLIWNGSWGGSTDDVGYEINLGENGELFIVGYTNSYGAGSSDMVLLKYDKNKQLQWYQTWGYSSVEYGRDLVVDSAGNIFCVGITTDPGFNNLALVKFLPNGVIDWNRTWHNNYDAVEGFGIALDSNEDIYLVGESNTNIKDYILLKYDNNGTRIWNKTWTGDGSDYFSDVEIDESDNLYCVGQNGGYAFIGKYYSNGTHIWNHTWTEGYANGGYKSVQIDSSGDIYCLGHGQNSTTMISDLILSKFHPNGTLLWNISWSYTDYENEGEDLFVDENTDEIYCVGHREFVDRNSTLAKFYPNGTRAWNISNVGSYYGITINQTSGYIYIAGRFKNGSYYIRLSEYLGPPIEPVLDVVTPNPCSTGIIDIDWDDTYRATMYYVYRNTSEITDVQGLTPIGNVSESNYTDIVSDDGYGMYFYTIVAENTVGNSSISNCESVIYDEVPDTPVLEVIDPNPSTTGIIYLNWSDSSRATVYYIYRNSSEINSLLGLTPIGEVSESNYTDIISEDGYGMYYYAIVAGNSAWNSSISNCESVSYTAQAPSPIPGFSLISIIICIITVLIIFQRREKSINKKFF